MRGLARGAKRRADGDARTWIYDLQRRRAKRGASAERGVISKKWGARSEATKRYEYWTPSARIDKDPRTWKYDVQQDTV